VTESNLVEFPPRHLIRGLSQPWTLFAEIEYGAEFFFSEEDYLTSEQVVKETMTRRVKKTSKGWRTAGRKSGKTRVKAETPPTTTLGASPSSYSFVGGMGGSSYISPVPSSSSFSSSSSSPPSSVTSMSSMTSLGPPLPKKVSASSSRSKKRPRRSAASTVKSYLVPDSDDDSILDEHKPDSVSLAKSKEAGKRKAESNLQRWIKHLTTLQKEELRKVSRH